MCPASGALSAVNGKGRGDDADMACAVSAQAAMHKPSSQKALRFIIENRWIQGMNVDW